MAVEGGSGDRCVVLLPHRVVEDLVAEHGADDAQHKGRDAGVAAHAEDALLLLLGECARPTMKRLHEVAQQLKPCLFLQRANGVLFVCEVGQRQGGSIE